MSDPAVAQGETSLAATLADAAQIVAAVAAGASLRAELERSGSDDPRARAARIDFTHGTLRRYGRSQALVQALSHRGSAEPRVEALLWCALYALHDARHAPYTVVDQAVRACGLIERWPARGFVNGALRRYQREREALEAQVDADPQARYQHPQWWIDAVRDDHPDAWQAVLEAGNAPAPMCLRVNRRRSSLDAYAARLEGAGIAARAVGPLALRLERAVGVDRLPGFSDGMVSVQDAGAQRAVPFLDLAPGQRVLDACAAPGGKSAHLLEAEDVDLLALDIDEKRGRRIAANLQRLGLHAALRTGDCRVPEGWWNGVPFERVLADVPCSASGVVRRNPDLKWLRRASDLDALATTQGAILDALWRVLAPNGKLLYATCSIFARENDAVIDAFLARTCDARRLALPGAAPAQMLPGPLHDGFFYALLARLP